MFPPLEACQLWAGEQESFKKQGRGGYRLSAALTAMGGSTGFLQQSIVPSNASAGINIQDSDVAISVLFGHHQRWHTSQWAEIGMKKNDRYLMASERAKEGLVKWATPWRLLILSYEKVRVQIFPYLWQLRMTQLLAMSDRHSTLKVHWAPRNPFPFSTEGCTNNSRWYRSITKLLNVS